MCRSALAIPYVDQYLGHYNPFDLGLSESYFLDRPVHIRVYRYIPEQLTRMRVVVIVLQQIGPNFNSYFALGTSW